MANYKVNFNVVDYVSLVNALAKGFFDENGIYVPHLGRINAMALFYDNCMAPNGEAHDMENLNDANEMFANEEFIDAFTEAVIGDGKFRLDFANAYADALKIVEQKKAASTSIVEVIQTMLSELVNDVGNMLNEDNIEKLNRAVAAVREGSFNRKEIEEAFGKSPRIDEIGKKD